MPDLRPMYMSDLPKVLEIITDHDEDDGQSAEAEYHESGFDHQFILEVDNKIVGVTGYRPVEATDHTAWLNWTYLDEDYRGKGHGKSMTKQLIAKLEAEHGRKLFVKVSTYEDDEDGKVYETALKMYKSIGFKEEVTNKDFYDEDEDQIILGLTLSEDAVFSDEKDLKVEEEKPIIRFNGLHEIAETEAAYTFDWTVNQSKKLLEKRNFTVEDLELGINSVKSAGGRKLFLTFPSNLPLIHQPLQAAGFKFAGQLTDYYEVGVHDLHFTHDLNNS